MQKSVTYYYVRYVLHRAVCDQERRGTMSEVRSLLTLSIVYCSLLIFDICDCAMCVLIENL